MFKNGKHIGIYVGDGKMIDAPKPGDKVRIREVYETPTAIRRMIPDDASTSVNMDSVLAGVNALGFNTSGTSATQSAYSQPATADVLGMTDASRTSFDLATLGSGLGIGA